MLVSIATTPAEVRVRVTEQRLMDAETARVV